MQPSPSLGWPFSSWSLSVLPEVGIVTPAGQPSPAVVVVVGGGVAVVVVGGVVVTPGEVVVVAVVVVAAALIAALTWAAVTAVPTPIRPFMPAAAWPGKVHRY